MITWAWKNGLNEQALLENPLQELLRLYRHASDSSKADETTREACRMELVKLQQGDAENFEIWQRCIELSRDGSGSLDVVEIDAASHNGVDDARDLRERAAFAPARDRYKIFILDEAHMVTPQGFNALLKIVEEPPAHVKFIFATTEPVKVISTIRSRTHHYPFRLLPPAQMHEYL